MSNKLVDGAEEITNRTDFSNLVTWGEEDVIGEKLNWVIEKDSEGKIKVHEGYDYKSMREGK